MKISTQVTSGICPYSLVHQPVINTYASSPESWYGLQAREVKIGFESKIFLIPIFGHTMGHCGVAIQQRNKWLFFIGDAYYYRMETETEGRPVSQFAATMADSNELRIQGLTR